MHNMKQTFTVWMLSVLFCLTASAREREPLNDGWRFLRADTTGAEQPEFDDSQWRTVCLPHDAAIESTFRKKGQGAYASNGFLPLGRGWYRRHLAYNEDWQGRRVIIEFEGVYRDAQLYVNGQKCGERQQNGYLDFERDITDLLHDGDNVLAVNYDNTYARSSRWYNGEGINRQVWLKVLEPLHVARYGTYVTTPKITPQTAKVVIETDVCNEQSDSVLCQLVTDIYDPQGRCVATTQALAPFKSGETYTFHQEITVNNPQLWQVGHGVLYRAVSTVSRINGAVYGQAEGTAETTDTYETTFGIREIEMKPDCGLLVNGKRVYVNGVCLHTDLGPLGAASLNAAWNRRLSAIVDTLGCNGIRLSHNAYPQYVLDWCDRRGILVFDEFFDKWNESFYGKGVQLGDNHFRDIEIQLSRDRNHPSVFIWSVGNEVLEQIYNDKTQKHGVERLKRLIDFVHKTEPSRKATVGLFPNRYGSISRRMSKNFKKFTPHPFYFYSDVVSTNYTEDFWDEDHKRYPQLIFLESELAVGDLGYTYFNYKKDYPIGHFWWGGTDYIGESFGWPAKGWMRGLIDFTNRLKPIGQSIKSFTNPEPMVKIVTRPHKGQGSILWNDLKITWTPLEEHWNYKKGDTLAIQVMSNCQETELFLNGRSLGRKQLPSGNQAPELVWTDIAYEPGQLRAVGYANSCEVTDVLSTAGDPCRILCEADCDTLRADGQDLVYLNYRVVDSNGQNVHDKVRLDFNVSGPATIAGVGTDDICSDEPWQANYRTTSNGRAQLIIRSQTTKGKVTVKAKARGMKTAVTTITAVK